MYSLFDNNRFTTLIFVLLFGLALRLPIILGDFFLPGILGQIPEPLVIGVGAKILAEVLPNSPLFNILLSLVLVLILGLQLNLLFSRHRIFARPTYAPAAVIILFCSIFPDFFYQVYILLALNCLAFALHNFGGTFRAYFPASKIFNGGLFIALASMFFAPFLIFLVWGWWVWRTYRPIRLREMAVLVSGFVVPYFLITTGLFWFDQLDWLSLHLAYPSALGISFSLMVTTYPALVKLILFSVLLAFFVLSFSFYYSRKSMHLQKIISSGYSFLLFSLLSLLLIYTLRPVHFLLFAYPFSFLMALSMAGFNNSWKNNLFFLLVVVALGFQALLFVVI